MLDLHVDADVQRGPALCGTPLEGLAEALGRPKPEMTRGEGRRHRRKYAKGNLGPDWTFVFRGPGQRLSLRARNLSQFLELAEGVDDETRMYHFLTFASATTPPGSPTV